MFEIDWQLEKKKKKGIIVFDRKAKSRVNKFSRYDQRPQQCVCNFRSNQIIWSDGMRRMPNLHSKFKVTREKRRSPPWALIWLGLSVGLRESVNAIVVCTACFVISMWYRDIWPQRVEEYPPTNVWLRSTTIGQQWRSLIAHIHTYRVQLCHFIFNRLCDMYVDPETSTSLRDPSSHQINSLRSIYEMRKATQCFQPNRRARSHSCFKWQPLLNYKVNLWIQIDLRIELEVKEFCCRRHCRRRGYTILALANMLIRISNSIANQTAN